MSEPANRSREDLEGDLNELRAAPGDDGELKLIVSRPGVEERELIESGRLDLDVGLVGDNWLDREEDASDPDLETQLTIMNARSAATVSGGEDPERWALAGDQLYVDMDIGVDNLPAGTRLGIGEAVVEVAPEPHLGCGKFVRRFGVDAMKFVNSEVGRELRLRGLNARIVEPGTIAVGQRVHKL